MEFKLKISKGQLVSVNGYRFFEAFLASYFNIYSPFPGKNVIVLNILRVSIPVHITFKFPFPHLPKQMTPFSDVFPAPVTDVYFHTIGQSLGEWITALLNECELQMPKNIVPDDEYTYVYEIEQVFQCRICRKAGGRNEDYVCSKCEDCIRNVEAHLVPAEEIIWPTEEEMMTVDEAEAKYACTPKKNDL